MLCIPLDHRWVSRDSTRACHDLRVSIKEIRGDAVEEASTCEFLEAVELNVCGRDDIAHSQLLPVPFQNLIESCNFLPHRSVEKLLSFRDLRLKVLDAECAVEQLRNVFQAAFDLLNLHASKFIAWIQSCHLRSVVHDGSRLTHHLAIHFQNWQGSHRELPAGFHLRKLLLVQANVFEWDATDTQRKPNRLSAAHRVEVVYFERRDV
mmetsp:Transcript_5422/g.10952  ORF Transcript_5422/g.10952 Transcript_5422/m.10952 type:complete len:207 (+) Transcript_5422:36-656(+)